MLTLLSIVFLVAIGSLLVMCGTRKKKKKTDEPVAQVTSSDTDCNDVTTSPSSDTFVVSGLVSGGYSSYSGSETSLISECTQLSAMRDDDEPLSMAEVTDGTQCSTPTFIPPYTDLCQKRGWRSIRKYLVGSWDIMFADASEDELTTFFHDLLKTVNEDPNDTSKERMIKVIGEAYRDRG
ncbi:hypothetical protein PENTCL1PPCAC_25594, partial [Pristionchus entomophagus]